MLKEQREQMEKELRDKEEERELRKRKDEAKRAFRKKMEHRRWYSTNFKLGALRIGDKVLLVMRHGANMDSKRVVALEKINNGHQTAFRVYYYNT